MILRGIGFIMMLLGLFISGISVFGNKELTVEGVFTVIFLMIVGTILICLKYNPSKYVH